MKRVYRNSPENVPYTNQGYYTDVPMAPQSNRLGILEKLYHWIFHFDDGAWDELRQKAPEYQIKDKNVPRDSEQAALYNQAEQIKRALQDWKTAMAYFESVSDPALIDYAAYDMEAAKRKYIYLLNSAKEVTREA